MAPPRPARNSLSELALLQREIGRLVERMAEFDRSDPPAAGEWSPSIDVFDCRGSLTVVVEVPGVPPDSLRVVLKDYSLIVSGERRERRPAGVVAFHCMERPHGRFRRTIPLDKALDVRGAAARLGDGVLTVSIPRLKERRGRETLISVRHEAEE